ncbi:MAG: DUF3096 domain-containing protein [Gammaproteobacteria bacterium]
MRRADAGRGPCGVIGILILIVPGFLNYLVAIYLIVIGMLGLMPK